MSKVKGGGVLFIHLENKKEEEEEEEKKLQGSLPKTQARTKMHHLWNKNILLTSLTYSSTAPTHLPPSPPSNTPTNPSSLPAPA